MLTGIMAISGSLFLLGTIMLLRAWKSSQETYPPSAEIKKALVGRDGLKKNNIGLVEMDGKKYSAILAMGSRIDSLKRGAEVEVTGFDGKFLIVKPLP